MLAAIFASGYVGMALMADHGDRVVSGDCGTDEWAVDRHWSCAVGPLPIPRSFVTPFGALVVAASLGLIPVAILAASVTLVRRLAFKPDAPREHVSKPES